MAPPERALPRLRRIDPRRRLTGLWRNADFLKLWGSLTITHFGGQITFLALPLAAALTLQASALQIGVLTALETLPYPLFGLLAGVLVDRSRKLPVIIWADVGRGLALAAVPLAAWLGVLSMNVLYVVGFLVGTGTVVGWPAYQVFMTERVGRENLVEANSKIGISDSASQLVGPGIAGALIQWLTAPVAVLFDAASFFLSAWMLRGIQAAPSDAPTHAAASVYAEIREGLVAVWSDPVLRTLAWALAVWQIFRHAYVAVVILFAARELGFSAGHVGALFVLAGLGSLAAAWAARPLNARHGFGATLLGALAGTGVAWLIVGASAGGPVLASAMFGLGLFLLDFCAMTFFINYLTLRQTVTPDRLLGRVTATMICLTVSTAPLGALAGGWIGEHWGLRASILLAGVGALALAPVIAWVSPIGGMRELHARREPVQAESLTEELPGT